MTKFRPRRILEQRQAPWTWGAIVRWGVFLWAFGYALGFGLAMFAQARIGAYDPFAQEGFWSDAVRILF